MEARISTMAIEREEERSRLEDKLKQLEEDLGDQTSSILFGTQLLIDHQKTSSKNIVSHNIQSQTNNDDSMSVKIPR